MELGPGGARVPVTAGAGGIGLEIVRAFLGARPGVHVRDVDEAPQGLA